MGKNKTNGAAPAKGQAAPHAGKLFEVTLPDSGLTLRYRRLSPLMMLQIQRDFPEPQPPVVAVRYGDEVREEVNEDDPAYQAALTRHQTDLNWIGIMTAIDEGVVLDAPQAEVQAFRDRYRERTRTQDYPDGKSLPGSDKLVYLMYMGQLSDRDTEALLEAMGRSSHPTEAAVAEVMATFPPAV